MELRGAWPRCPGTALCALVPGCCWGPDDASQGPFHPTRPAGPGRAALVACTWCPGRRGRGGLWAEASGGQGCQDFGLMHPRPLPRPGQAGCARDTPLEKGRLPMLKPSPSPVDSPLPVKGPANCITKSSPLKFLVDPPNGIDLCSRLHHAHLCPPEESALVPGGRAGRGCGASWAVHSQARAAAQAWALAVPPSCHPPSRLHPQRPVSFTQQLLWVRRQEWGTLAEGPGLLRGAESRATRVYGGVRGVTAALWLD